jgi:hypothetical protein
VRRCEAQDTYMFTLPGRYAYTVGVRMTIYVQDDLGERIKGRDDLNVSAVCQAALRRELELLTMTDTKSDRLARLRADRERYRAQRIDEGAAAGRAWAIDDASYEEVQALAQIDANEPFRFQAEGVFYVDDEREVDVLHSDDPFDVGFVIGATEVYLILETEA